MAPLPFPLSYSISRMLEPAVKHRYANMGYGSKHPCLAEHPFLAVVSFFFSFFLIWRNIYKTLRMVTCLTSIVLHKYCQGKHFEQWQGGSTECWDWNICTFRVHVVAMETALHLAGRHPSLSCAFAPVLLFSFFKIVQSIGKHQRCQWLQIH